MNARLGKTARLLSRKPAAEVLRGFAAQASGSPVFEVFNRRTKWHQKERAAANVQASRQADYLKDETAIRLCERLLVC
jgi:NADH dehydrogenase [ubiquinone] 1 alpha subcomplex assembly factor 5